MKKIFSLLLSLLVIMTMSVSVFATEPVLNITVTDSGDRDSNEGTNTDLTVSWTYSGGFD